MIKSMRNSFFSNSSKIVKHLCFFDLSFIILLMVWLLFYYHSRSLFYGFLCGNFYCLSFEISIFWRYVLYRFRERKSTYDVQVFFSKFSVFFIFFLFINSFSFQRISPFRVISLPTPTRSSRRTRRATSSSTNTLQTPPSQRSPPCLSRR